MEDTIKQRVMESQLFFWFFVICDPAQPIWDTFVLANTGVKRPVPSALQIMRPVHLAYAATSR